MSSTDSREVGCTSPAGAPVGSGTPVDGSAAIAPVARLAGGFAHGFNNLLTVIRGNAEMLRDQLADPRQRTMVDAMLVACGRAYSLTQQLLTVGGKQVIRPRAIDLDAKVAAWLQRHQLLFPADIEIRFEPGTGSAAVYADAGQLTEVLSRLSAAACDAIVAKDDLGGGHIVVRTERVRDPADLPPGDYVRLVLSHDGLALDDAALAGMFEPYGSAARLGDGADLGLAVVAGIVRQNQARVLCERGAGGWTTFVLDWPLWAASTVLVPQSPSAGRGELVMLVDDDDGVRQYAASVLRERGYEVAAFASGAAALRHLAEVRPAPAALVTDVIMPELDGKRLAAMVREILPALPVLFISGYSEDFVAQGGLPAGDIPLLDKPFSGDDLAVTVRALIDAAAAR